MWVWYVILHNYTLVENHQSFTQLKKGDLIANAKFDKTKPNAYPGWFKT